MGETPMNIRVFFNTKPELLKPVNDPDRDMRGKVVYSPVEGTGLSADRPLPFILPGS
jgi:hypothetical protein